MQLYADTPARRSRQVIADVVVLAWCWVWVWAGRLLTDAIDVLAQGVDALADGTGELKQSFQRARDAARELPVAGDELAEPLDAAARTGQSLQVAGIELAGQIHTVAIVAGVALALAGCLPVLALHLPRRLRWVRAAGEARMAALSDTGTGLLALRALVHTPLHQLRRLGPEPLEAYERGEYEQLARVELDRIGVRPRGRSREQVRPKE